jgi:glycosyltransferase involved in cell wall biosynthesis
MATHLMRDAPQKANGMNSGLPNTKTRVLFLAGSLAAGGSERQVLETLKGLDRSRFDLLLYTIYREGELLREVPGDVPIHSYWDRFQFPTLNWPGLIRKRQARDLAVLLNAEKIDVVYERNFPMTLLSDAACRIRPTPRIAVVSSDPAQDLGENAGRFPLLKRWYLQGAYRRATRVVAVSNGVAKSVCEHYRLPANRIMTIYNSIDPERIARLAGEYQPDFDPARFHIVSIGRLISAKGYRYLIEALEHLVHRDGLTRLCLWLVGSGPIKGQLEELVRRYRLSDHVNFTGFVSNPLPYAKGAQLFCLPSLYEGMPNALLEAVLCNTPVLASDCPSGPAEILDGGRVGRLIPPGDAQALRASIADAMVEFDQWQSLTRLAREHVLQRFGRANTIGRLEALLHELVTPPVRQ